MFYKLYNYLNLKFIKIFIVIILISILIIFIAQFVANITRASTLVDLILFALYDVPYVFQEVLPFIILLSTIYFIRQLSASNELDVIEASGVSIWYILLHLIFVVVIIGVITITIIEPIGSIFSYNKSSMINKNNDSIINLANNSFWIIDKQTDQQLIIKANKVNIEEQVITLYNPIVLQIAKNILISRISSNIATIVGNKLIINNAYIKDQNLFPYIKKQFIVNTNLTSKNLQNISLSPAMINIWDFPHFINNLNKMGINSDAYKVYFYGLLFYPFLLISMLLMGIGLSSSKQKRISSTIIIVKGVTLGFSTYFLTRIINSFATNGVLPPLSSILAEVLLILSFSLYLILSKKGL